MSRPTSTPIITRASIADVTVLVPLFDGYRQFYGKKSEPDRCEFFLRERLFRGESVIFLARTNDMASGFTQLYPTFSSVNVGRIWHLNDLFVAPQARRLGVGRALMLHAVAFARQDGALRLTLETQVGNAQARALYEKLGMTLGTEFVKYALPF
jgi:ribosomal protein S18 acetylase RimI-like enzyme